MTYNFDVDEVYDQFRYHWKSFMDKLGADKVVIGISGGKDSTVCAYLAAELFGPKNVYGVMMPCDEQADISDSREVIKLTGINSVEINVGDAYHSIIDSVENNAIEPSEQARVNLGPRLRMSTLFAVAQSVGGVVICTSNKSEIILGYGTYGGDDFGSYAPLKDLTVTEVIALGKHIGIPAWLVDKVPSDGLCGKSDEDNIGMKYADVDNAIRLSSSDISIYTRVLDRYTRNKFKSDIVRIPGPTFKMPDFISGNDKER